LRSKEDGTQEVVLEMPEQQWIVFGFGRRTEEGG